MPGIVSADRNVSHPVNHPIVDTAVPAQRYLPVEVGRCHKQRRLIFDFNQSRGAISQATLSLDLF